MATTVTLESRIPELIARSEQRAAAAVAKTGLDIEAGAKERAPVDTGFLMNTIIWLLETAWRGEVRVGAEYGIYVEGGSVHPPRETKSGGTTRAYTIAPQPFFAPAVEDARPGFEAAVAQLYA
jgi:hypothetical protein